MHCIIDMINFTKIIYVYLTFILCSIRRIDVWYNVLTYPLSFTYTVDENTAKNFFHVKFFSLIIFSKFFCSALLITLIPTHQQSVPMSRIYQIVNMMEVLLTISILLCVQHQSLTDLVPMFCWYGILTKTFTFWKTIIFYAI